MQEEEKTQYTRIGLGLSGIVVGSQTAEIIWRTIEGIQEKKGDFSIKDTAKIEVLVKGKFDSSKKVTLEQNKTEKKPHEKSKEVKPVVSIKERNKLPVISVGGREIKLTRVQSKNLRDKIKRFGINSEVVSVEMMTIASETRTEKAKNGKIKQVNISKNKN